MYWRHLACKSEISQFCEILRKVNFFISVNSPYEAANERGNTERFMVGSSHSWKNQTALTPLAHQIPEACARVGIGRTMMYQLINEGKIKPIKVGRRTLIPESELQKLIAGQTA
jgi:excisionase family DNA binding protein